MWDTQSICKVGGYVVVRVGLFGDLWDLEIEFRMRHRAQYTTATAEPVTFSAGIQEWWFSIKPQNLPEKALLTAFHCVSPWEDTSWTYSKRQMTIRCTDQSQRYIQNVDMQEWGIWSELFSHILHNEVTTSHSADTLTSEHNNPNLDTFLTCCYF